MLAMQALLFRDILILYQYVGLFFRVDYVEGSIPLSIFLASSVVQDGHGMLPLLAESRRDFFKVKSINLVVGLLVGITGFLIVW